MISAEKEADGQISFLHEIWRKLTHMGALVIPGGYYILGLSKGEMLAILIPVSILALFADISRLRNWRFWKLSFCQKLLAPMVRKHEEDGDFSGATYILLSFCLTIGLYTKPIALTAITFIIVGDTFAALIGRKVKSLRFYKNKTIAGSIGCLAGMVMVAFLAPILISGIDLQVALAGAVIGTVFEAFSFGIDDNVTVPILSGLFMTLLMKIITFL